MKKNAAVSLLLSLCLTFSLCAPIAAQGTYLPDVTEEMADASYWTDKQENAQEVIMSAAEIDALNQGIIDAKGTSVMDFKTFSETFDGKARNDAIKASATSDAEYYFGWTYGADGEKAQWSYYQKMIDNCCDYRAQKEQSVKYGIAVERTLLRVFPSFNPIWDDPTDPDFDYQALSGIRVNEPLIIYTTSADGKFYLARISCCSGWVPVEDVAICRDKEEWLSAWDIPEEDTLMVCTTKLFTAVSNSQPETSKRMLTMGTALELVKEEDIPALVGNRAVYHNYAVYLPVREEDGSYCKMMALIPQSAEVHVGYLPLTCENIAEVAMRYLGDAYGWGGMMESEDCSGMVRMIYACFGLDIARNGNWQWNMPIAKVNMSYLTDAEKCAILDQLPLGTALCFSGHEMLYLGKSDGKYYVLSSVSKIMDPTDSTKTQRIRSVVINTLDVRRANGHTWLADLNKAMMPAYGLNAEKEHSFPENSWYYEGMSYCLGKGLMSRSDEGDFAAEQDATRAQVVEALWKLAGKPESEADLPFGDVAADASYVKAVQWAFESGIAAGVNETCFAPEAAITREQLACMLWRFTVRQGAEDSTGTSDSLSPYCDAADISDYACRAMQWAIDAALITGTSATKLTPQSTCTRAQLATVLMRLAG